ncbi:MAG: nucleotidyltransferase domain-containing protein [Thermodesulfobacteriota bacterium]
MAVLARSRPGHSVCDLDREALLAALREALSAQPVHAAFMIGSVARGDCHAWSDIDLIVVCETDLPFLERPRLFEAVYNLGFAVDLLVYTPAEFEAMEANPTSFWRDAAKDRLRII